MKRKNTYSKSTYALLVRSQNEERSLPETAAYLLLALAITFSVWQSTQQPFEVPSVGLLPAAPIAQTSAPATPLA